MGQSFINDFKDGNTVEYRNQRTFMFLKGKDIYDDGGCLLCLGEFVDKDGSGSEFVVPYCPLLYTWNI